MPPGLGRATQAALSEPSLSKVSRRYPHAARCATVALTPPDLGTAPLALEAETTDPGPVGPPSALEQVLGLFGFDDDLQLIRQQRVSRKIGSIID